MNILNAVTITAALFLFSPWIMSAEPSAPVEKMSIETVLDKGENIVSISEGEAVVDQQSKKIIRKIGLWVTRIRPDMKVSEDRYNEEGKLDGQQIRFGVGAIKTRDLTYKNGVLEGKSFFYDPATGKLIKECDYKNNVLDGQVIYYKDDGTIKDIKKYTNGKEAAK